MAMLRRDDALKILREHKQELAEKYGVTRIGIFGSVARDEATENSDMDVVVEMKKLDPFYSACQRPAGNRGALPRGYRSLWRIYERFFEETY